MNRLFIALSLTLSLGLAGSPASAGEDKVVAQGQKLHNEKCTSCHSTDVYTRENRRVNSMDALAHQVNNCMKGPAKADWTPTETNAVIEYLNTRFYKF